MSISKLSVFTQKQYQSLSLDGQTHFNREYAKGKKTLFAMFLCWSVMCHYVYVGKWGVWLAYVFSGGFFGVWCVIDIFRLNGMVKDHNEQVANDLILMIKSLEA